MGKKGKKRKEKVTGTPDVVKFKGTHDFHTLKEAVVVQESLPFVASDLLNEMDMKKVSRFLHILGLLGTWAGAVVPKDYRFRLHHRFFHPAPQYFPTGYSKNIITAARWVTEKHELTFNGVSYPFSEELKSKADEFLKQVDTFMTNVSGFIELSLKDDFAQGGLKAFKFAMKEKLSQHDGNWCMFEEAYMQALNETHMQVFAPVEKLVSLEDRLTKAEEQGAVDLKQQLENELVCSLEEFINSLFPETKDAKFPDDVIPLAEACVFYESKCPQQWLTLCKYLIKAYLELRIYITNIPTERLYPQLHDNTKLIRLLKALHKSVVEALEALEAVAKFPRLAYCKTEGWMTKALLEPEVLEMMDGGRPR